MTDTVWSMIDSPLGALFVARDGVGLTQLYLSTGRHTAQSARPDWVRDDTAFDDARAQLAEYFAGTRTSFDLPMHPVGTPFQLRVWAALCEIPCGETRSYGQQAAAIGADPRTASRAVGLANGKNPISIIVPCHRVIGADGSLTGYGGGLPAKKWLLEHESQQATLFAV